VQRHLPADRQERIYTDEQDSFSLVDTMIMKKVNINILPVGEVALKDLTYVVIGAREKGKWIFVRHRERESWELPAGHIEKNEQALDAAKRELYEETGTLKAEIRVLNDYSVTIRGKISYGRIFFAAVEERGPLPESEIAEILIAEKTPLPATYPEAHKVFVRLLEKYIRQSSR
jgi:8-oxo-dGTP diphosphatase